MNKNIKIIFLDLCGIPRLGWSNMSPSLVFRCLKFIYRYTMCPSFTVLTMVVDACLEFRRKIVRLYIFRRFFTEIKMYRWILFILLSRNYTIFNVSIETNIYDYHRFIMNYQFTSITNHIIQRWLGLDKQNKSTKEITRISSEGDVNYEWMITRVTMNSRQIGRNPQCNLNHFSGNQELTSDLYSGLDSWKDNEFWRPI